MSSKYGGYKTHAVRESLLTWSPHVPSRAQQESKYETPYISEIPDAASLSTSMSIRATMGMQKAEYHAPTKTNEVAVLPIQKPCATKSSMSSTFIDFREEVYTRKSSGGREAGACLRALAYVSRRSLVWPSFFLEILLGRPCDSSPVPLPVRAQGKPINQKHDKLQLERHHPFAQI